MAYTSKTRRLYPEEIDNAVYSEIPIGHIVSMASALALSCLAIYMQVIVFRSVFASTQLSLALGIIIGLMSHAALSVLLSSRAQLTDALRAVSSTAGGVAASICILSLIALMALEVQILIAAGYASTKAFVLIVGTQTPAAISVAIISRKTTARILSDEEFTLWFEVQERLAIAEEYLRLLATYEIGIAQLRRTFRFDDMALRMTNPAYTKALALHHSVVHTSRAGMGSGPERQFRQQLEEMSGQLPFAIMVTQQMREKAKQDQEDAYRRELSDILK